MKYLVILFLLLAGMGTSMAATYPNRGSWANLGGSPSYTGFAMSVRSPDPLMFVSIYYTPTKFNVYRPDSGVGTLLRQIIIPNVGTATQFVADQNSNLYISDFIWGGQIRKYNQYGILLETITNFLPANERVAHLTMVASPVNTREEELWCIGSSASPSMIYCRTISGTFVRNIDLSASMPEVQAVYYSIVDGIVYATYYSSSVLVAAYVKAFRLNGTFIRTLYTAPPNNPNRWYYLHVKQIDDDGNLLIVRSESRYATSSDVAFRMTPLGVTEGAIMWGIANDPIRNYAYSNQWYYIITSSGIIYWIHIGTDQLSAPVDQRFGIHHVVYVKDGIMYYRYAAGKESYVAAVTIGAGTKPSLVVLPSRRLSLVCQDSNGAIQRRYSRDLGRTWSMS